MIESLEPASDVIRDLASLLVDATAHGASVGFLDPLDPEKAAAFWRGSFAEATAGRRVILGARENGRLLGTVTLVFAAMENQQHRADVSKLLVLHTERGRGLGERLMAEVEARAARAGRTLLVLDTATPEAARLYQRRGWRLTGEIPDYALMPDGSPCATAFYWKRV